MYVSLILFMDTTHDDTGRKPDYYKYYSTCPCMIDILLFSTSTKSKGGDLPNTCCKWTIILLVLINNTGMHTELCMKSRRT